MSDYKFEELDSDRLQRLFLKNSNMNPEVTKVSQQPEPKPQEELKPNKAAKTSISDAPPHAVTNSELKQENDPPINANLKFLSGPVN